ncbi:zinc-binding dehydrogenase [Streptomyces sp. NPDC003857]
MDIATTRGAYKKQALLDAGAAHVIVSDEEDLPTRVKEMTNGEGGRLAFDPVAGPGVDTLAEALAPGGLRRAVAFVNAGLSDGSIAPIVDRTFGLDDVADAHRYMESNAQTVKIVITVGHRSDAS